MRNLSQLENYYLTKINHYMKLWKRNIKHIDNHQKEEISMISQKYFVEF